MATIWVDGRQHEADSKQNLLHRCLTLGYNLPYFCWHPALGSVGACRQCAVKQFKDADDTKGRLVMACMTPASDGTRISIEDPEAVEFRKGIIEGMMLSHPHDCPVCDEGGECHLQDMTVMTGHDYRRYRFQKRTFRNQYLGPLVNHEMNRCIQCYRCVRYYREYAGGSDLNAFALRNLVYFGRQEDGILESEFSGNLVEICPTGVFTDATLKHHYTRKWDLQFGPSICVHCGLGCNTSAAERYRTLRRIVNRYNGDVNGYFLCDRGRYGYEFVNSQRRISEPEINGGAVTHEAAVARLRSLIAEGNVIGIGSPRASLESNFALRALVGPERFFAGVPEVEQYLVLTMIQILRDGPARTPCLRDIEQSDAALVLGEDLPNVAPRMALTLRQSVRQQPMQLADKLGIPRWLDQAVREAVHGAHGPLYSIFPAPTRLDEFATETLCAAPDDIARLGFAVAHALDAGEPSVEGLAGDAADLAQRIAAALRSAARPMVIAGGSLRSEAIIRAAAAVARALVRAGKAETGLSYVAPECNTVGLALFGAPPLMQAFAAAAGTVIILENDLYRRAPAAKVDGFLQSAKHVIALDHLANVTTDKAELVLPASTFAEGDGTLVSNEGRAQRFFQVYVPNGGILESWRWLGRDSWAALDDVIGEMCAALPRLAAARDAAPLAAFREAGQKVPREPHRFSGRTAMHAHINVSEPKPPDDPDSPLAFSMEGYPDQPPSPLIPFFWAPGWNSIQSLNRFQEEIAGPLRGGNPGVRLIEPGAGGAPASGAIPPAFEARPNEWLVIPLYHIFGSEELSAAAPGLAQLAPAPYVALGPEDARSLGLESGQRVELLGGRELPLTILPGLARGVAGLAEGFAGTRPGGLPAWSPILKKL